MQPSIVTPGVQIVHCRPWVNRQSNVLTTTSQRLSKFVKTLYLSSSLVSWSYSCTRFTLFNKNSLLIILFRYSLMLSMDRREAWFNHHKEWIGHYIWWRSILSHQKSACWRSISASYSETRELNCWQTFFEPWPIWLDLWNLSSYPMSQHLHKSRWQGINVVFMNRWMELTYQVT